MKETEKIAIVGGGFSGVCTAIHLIMEANQPFVLYLIEKNSHFCEGVAYGTLSPFHLLNVRAEYMGVLADQPDHFYRWLKENKDWRLENNYFKDLVVYPDSYLPRQLYAIYLKKMLKDALMIAKKKQIECHLIQDQALDIEWNTHQEITLILEKHIGLRINQLILGLGTQQQQAFSFENKNLIDHCYYISNIWTTNIEQCLSQLQHHISNPKLIVIGAGLTAVDTLSSLYASNFTGHIDLISKTGAFPRAHLSNWLPPCTQFDVEEVPHSIPKLLHMFRNLWKQEKEIGLDWRQLIDSFRPYTQKIWKSLSLFSKKQFMRHLFSIWNKHRHRMAPQSAAIIRHYEENRQLRILSGKVQTICSLPDKTLQLTYIETLTGEWQKAKAHMIINCSGPSYKIQHSTHPFLQNLFNKEYIQLDDMGLGLKVIENEIIAKKGSSKIYALGSLLFGEYFETIAVPELRRQAKSIALNIIKHMYL